MAEWFRLLEAWHEFYAFVGGAAATLMGLMFVVISLNQAGLATDEGARVTRGFFTPIVVFFATIIVVAMLMLVPGTQPLALSLMLAAVAVSGFIYMVATGAHSTWRTSELGLDDLLWYVVLPYASYFAIGFAAFTIWRGASFGFYSAALAMLLLLLIAVRNAWDLVVYSIQRSRRG